MSILPDRVLEWVIESVDPEATIQSIHRMQGGISSIVCSISLQTKHADKEVVLRLFDNAEWVRNEPDLARHEAECLRLASHVDAETPQIIAFDEDGSKCGMPAVLMTKLNGSVVLTPPDMEAWLNGLARSLVQIHKVSADSFPWKYRSYMDPASYEIPTWSDYPEQWGRVVNIAKGPHPSVKQCFIHRDYHPTNVLWADGQVSGIVDWVNSCQGPAGVDIGHCRWNIAMLYGVETADAFLSAYERLAGSEFCYDPYWDIKSLMDVQFGTPEVYPGWTALGFEGLTDELMKERTDSYMLSLLKRAAT
ncbi:phosphotransferase family protein [Paenibacillus marinisediminis]